MFQALGIDAFTALSLIMLASVVGALMCLTQFTLQVVYDKQGFGWREALLPALALSVAFGVLVTTGAAWDGVNIKVAGIDGLVVTVMLMTATLGGGFLGRLVGWAVMRLFKTNRYRGIH